MKYYWCTLIWLGGWCTPLFATEVVWPTSMNRQTIHSFEDFIQPTVSGEISSGTFGMVREDGKRFHEGLDIRPSRVLANGEAADRIFSAIAGKVAYLNHETNGPYGKYVVLVHPEAEIEVYTLYAHLAAIDKNLRVGDPLPQGKAIALMGRSSTPENPTPLERSHLHFEVGLRLSDSFNRWYNKKNDPLKNPNLHGIWNGQNLVGFDPSYILKSTRVNLLDVVHNLPTALAVVIRTRTAPDFVYRYPGLTNGEASTAAGWYIEFTWHGLPKHWTALPADSKQLPSNGFKIVGMNPQMRDLMIQRQMLASDGKKPGEILIQNLEILLSNSR